MLDAHSALIIIDLQNAIDHPSWGVRNNPHAEPNVAKLLKVWRLNNVWRTNNHSIYHVRHDSLQPHSHYRPGQPGNDFKPEAMPKAGEPIIVKHTNSAFVGTNLEARLRAAGHTRLFIAGVITNNSVEATVRMAGNLGFETFLIEDACFTFAKRDWNGTMRSAEEVHAMSLANLHGEYCTVIKTADIVEQASAS